MSTNKKIISPVIVIVAAALFLVTVANRSFLYQVFQQLPDSSLDSLLFFSSIFWVLGSLIILLISFLLIFLGLRTACVTLIVLSAPLAYATAAYGIVFDKTMIVNFLETDSHEAMSYVNSFAIFIVGVSGVIPVWILIRFYTPRPYLKEIISGLKVTAVSLLSVLLIGSFYYKDFAAFFRNHHELTKYVIPVSFIDASIKVAKKHINQRNTPLEILDPAPKINPNAMGVESLTVIVVGETARADHFQLLGYPRNTNPELTASNLALATDIASCGTATAVSVPCMFSRLDRNEYSHYGAAQQENVLDIIQKAGYEVYWIDNNSSCKGVCKRVNQTTIEHTDPKVCEQGTCYDDVLITALEDYISFSTASRAVVVLHMMGSHGPTYFQRYPESFRKFTPDCAQSDIQHCSEEALINTYDNTIVYTDHVLAGLIRVLENSQIEQTQMMYVSDHGESLGESGLYLHGFPYAIAPASQTTVPFLYWRNGAIVSENSCSNHNRELFSHDNIFDTFLGATSVISNTYKPERDMLSHCLGQQYEQIGQP